MVNILIEVLTDFANPVQCSATCFKCFRVARRAGEKRPLEVFYKKVVPKVPKVFRQNYGFIKNL